MEGLEHIPIDTRHNSLSHTGNLYTPPATVITNPSTGTISLTSETAFLLQAYVRTVATWMDLFDFQSSYQLRVAYARLQRITSHCLTQAKNRLGKLLQ
jgi:hypothetical protein